MVLNLIKNWIKTLAILYTFCRDLVRPLFGLCIALIKNKNRRIPFHAMCPTCSRIFKHYIWLHLFYFSSTFSSPLNFEFDLCGLAIMRNSQSMKNVYFDRFHFQTNGFSLAIFFSFFDK